MVGSGRRPGPLGLLRLSAPMRRGESRRALEDESRLVRVASKVGRIGGWRVELKDPPLLIWSDEVARIHGLDMEGPPPSWDEMLAFFVQDDQEDVRAAFAMCGQMGVAFTREWRIATQDGRDAWVLCSGEPLRDRDGKIVAMEGAYQDITAWKRAELQADQQGRRLERFIKSLPIIVWTAESNGDVDFINDLLTEYCGKPVEELLGERWTSILHPDDVEGTLAKWAHARKTSRPLSLEYRLRRADGAYRWHKVAATPEYDASRTVVRWWGTAVDIDDARRLEQEAMRLAEEREHILRTIGDGVSTLDREWRFTYVSERAAELTLRRREDIEGRLMLEVFPEMEGTNMDVLYRQAMETGERVDLVTYNPVLERWFDVDVTPTSQGLTLYFRDITETRRLEEQLQKAQRLESIGQLTGGIAHDFNNLLTVVIGGAEAVSLDPSVSEESRELLDMMGQAAQRGAELTSRLLAFARRQPLAPQPVDVNAQIHDLVPLLKRTLGEGVALKTHLADGLPAAHVDPTQLESALLNLVINARDAMPDGGTLVLETRLAELDQEYTDQHVDVAPGAYVLASVSDTGTGISPESLERLFEPFFTTKPSGQGTGLGMPMVWGFIKQSGGHITVYTEEGLGTTIHLYLPLAEQPADGTAATGEEAPEEDPVQPGAGVVLLAEDDPLVQQFAAGQLRARGYEVVAVGSGPEALEALEGMERLDLLFTDVVMPGGMTGRQLAQAVVERRPGTPVLYASGYTQNVIVHDGRLDPDVELLAKPYTARQLAARVRQLLATPGEP